MYRSVIFVNKNENENGENEKITNSLTKNYLLLCFIFCVLSYYCMICDMLNFSLNEYE